MRFNPHPVKIRDLALTYFIHSFISFYSPSLLNSLTKKLQILKRSKKGRSSTTSDVKTYIR